MQEVKI
jgi:glucose-6-phosphate isomerase